MKDYKNLKYLALLIIPIVVIGFILINSREGENMLAYEQISQETAKEMMDNEEVIILDVREQSEYDEGHIEKSILLPLSRIKDDAESTLPDKDEKILVYCRSGNRSKQASSILADLGYTNIYEFGGVSTWEYGLVK